MGKILRAVRLAAAFLQDFFQNRELLWELTKKDFRLRYLGSYLGILWAFIQPLITVVIFWFVFEVGFRSRPVDNFPFILWLVSGLFPWFFIFDSINSAAGSVLENAFLVKKVVFRVGLLPLIKLISALIIHLFFVGILVFMFAWHGYWPTLFMLQVFYYLFAAGCLVLGVAWLTSALAVFLKDIGQLVAMALQFVFWGTPIFWSHKMVPPEYLPWIEWNPIYYIIEGYRDSFIYQRWFWEHPGQTLYFWLFTATVMLCGAMAFKKLRPHFADVL